MKAIARFLPEYIPVRREWRGKRSASGLSGWRRGSSTSMPSISNKRETYTHRPMQVSDDQLADNWERTFGAKQEAVPDVPHAEGDGKEGDGD